MTDELTGKQRSAVARAKRAPQLQRILFSEAKGFKWFTAFADAGFLNPAEMPTPIPARSPGYVSIPPWPVTEYLVGLCAELSSPEGAVYAPKILQFIRSTTGHARQHGTGNHRVWVQFAKLLAAMPAELLSAEDIENANYWLDDKYERGLSAEILGEQLLPSLIDKNADHVQQMALGFIEVIYKTRTTNRDFGEHVFKEANLRFDGWQAKRINAQVATKAGLMIGLLAVELFQQRLESLLTDLGRDAWSAVWRGAIEDHPQNQAADDAEDILVEAHRDSLLGYIDSAKTGAIPYVRALLHGQFDTTRRVAILSIDQRFGPLQDVASDIGDLKFFTPNCRHETWHLLRNHFSDLPGSTRRRVLGLISGLVYPGDDGRPSAKGDAYLRAIWLSAIKDYGGEAATMYQAAVEESGIVPEHPDFASFMHAGFATRESPLPRDELEALDVSELVEVLVGFKDSGRINEPSVQDLASTVRQIVKSNPLRYLQQIGAFLRTDLDLAYVDGVLEAYRELWSSKAALPWEEVWLKLLTFCEAMVSTGRLWQEDSRPFHGNGRWVVSSLGRLVEEGAALGENAIPEMLIPRTLSLLRNLLEREPGADFTSRSDPVTVAINSSRGHCVLAMINLALHACRTAKNQGASIATAWQAFEPDFDVELVRTECGLREILPLYVAYIPTFLYMSQEWTLKQLHSVFDQTDPARWLIAMRSFSQLATFYAPVYLRLRSGGHLERALETDELSRETRDRVIQHVTLAYVHGFEDLGDENSLIRLLLRRQKPGELNQLIWFLWTLRNSADSAPRQAALRLWPRLLENIDSSSQEGKEIMAHLGDWGVFIEVVNTETKPLLMAVSPFVSEGHHAWEFLKTLARISRKQPAEAYELWLPLLTGGAPDYPDAVIFETIGNIAQFQPSGLRMAKHIVSQYLRHGQVSFARALQEVVDRHTEPKPH